MFLSSAWQLELMLIRIVAFELWIKERRLEMSYLSIVISLDTSTLREMFATFYSSEKNSDAIFRSNVKRKLKCTWPKFVTWKRMHLLLQREFKIFPVELLVKENNTEVREYQSIEVRSLFFYESRSNVDKLAGKLRVQVVHSCLPRPTRASMFTKWDVEFLSIKRCSKELTAIKGTLEFTRHK